MIGTPNKSYMLEAPELSQSKSWQVENDLKMLNGCSENTEAEIAERNERAKKLYR